MARRNATFKQVDVVRAVKAVQAAGLEISGVEAAPDGTIRVITAQMAPAAASPFDLWKQRHASST
jgi:hypothetical protein